MVLRMIGRTPKNCLHPNRRKRCICCGAVRSINPSVKSAPEPCRLSNACLRGLYHWIQRRRRFAAQRWRTGSHILNNPLTWRSVVNRVWQYHFGRGLCDTPNDFGRMGSRPTHPELLDWLAVWFRDDAGGRLKELHRLILTSSTWQQSSCVDGNPIDSDNRLLWRMNRQRIDADVFRDSVLRLGGRLDLTMGGPGVEQFAQTKGPQVTPVLDYDPHLTGKRRKHLDAVSTASSGVAFPIRSWSRWTFPILGYWRQSEDSRYRHYNPYRFTTMISFYMAVAGLQIVSNGNVTR